MCSRTTIALVAVLGTAALAVPTVLRAEDQSEWLQRQLQITDGYAPPPALAAQGGDRAGASVSRGGALRASPPEELPAQNVHRAGASPIRHSAVRASHLGKPAPQPREVYQQPADAQEVPPCEAPVCDDPVAGEEEEPAPSQAVCTDCTAIESTREADAHGEGIGLAAVGLLLAVAGFKVLKTLGAIQQA